MGRGSNSLNQTGAPWDPTPQKMPGFSTPEEAHTHFQAPMSTGPCPCPWGPYCGVIVIALFLLLWRITADGMDNDGDRRISYPGGRSEGDYPQHSRRYGVFPPSLPLPSPAKLTTWVLSYPPLILSASSWAVDQVRNQPKSRRCPARPLFPHDSTRQFQVCPPLLRLL